MLIEFSVSNFRSIRERQTLSMVAAPRLKKRENVFEPKIDGEKFPSLLKVAVIYGPNASGKSNLLKALNVISTMTYREPSNRDLPLPVAPFRFDKALLEKPSEFEIHFVCGGMRYQFDLAATVDRIYVERLTCFPKGKESLIYERIFAVDGEVYKYGQTLTEGSLGDVLETWRKITPPKLLFISQAVANSSEGINQLKLPFEWLKRSSFSLLNGMSSMTTAAQRLAEKSEIHADSIASFLREVDVPISKIKSEAIEAPLNLLGSLVNNNTSDEKPYANSGSKFKTTLTHESALGSAELSLNDESDGTKNLLGFWLPWITKKPSDNSRFLMIVDELDSSLHPKIVSALVEKHINSEIPSQLIFTTHDTHLMDSRLLRRDQFWITERDINGATQVRSIHDFEGREGEDIEKRYYEGRYRGLPLLSRR
jgi:AAA15 family ATPase/GTPase